MPEHVEELRLDGALQPPKADPPLALALNVTIAPLSEVVMLGEHVFVTVCEAAFVPVPPHDTGALTVPVLGVIVTEPVPLPAKVSVQLRASLNAVCAVKPEDWPIAVRRKNSAEVDFLRSKVCGYEVALLVCGRGEKNIRICFREFVKIDVYLLVRLKTAAGDRDDLAWRVIGFVRGNTRLRAAHQLGGV